MTNQNTNTNPLSISDRYDDVAKYAELILKLSNTRKMLMEILEHTDFLTSIPTASLIRVQDHLMDARKSITAAVANME